MFSFDPLYCSSVDANHYSALSRHQDTVIADLLIINSAQNADHLPTTRSASLPSLSPSTSNSRPPSPPGIEHMEQHHLVEHAGIACRCPEQSEGHGGSTSGSDKGSNDGESAKPLGNVQDRQDIKHTHKIKKKAAKPKPIEELTPDELDKRRRNTEASARFRARRKLIQAENEKNVQQMKNQIAELETKLKEQQLEIKFLRSIIAERDRLLAQPITHQQQQQQPQPQEQQHHHPQQVLCTHTPSYNPIFKPLQELYADAKSHNTPFFDFNDVNNAFPGFGDLQFNLSIPQSSHELPNTDISSFLGQNLPILSTNSAGESNSLNDFHDQVSSLFEST